jgi:hypothetical protein
MSVFLGAVKNDKLVSKIYDYIVAVTIKQGRLLPIKDLYGDGTRWSHNYDVFSSVYNQIKLLIK